MKKDHDENILMPQMFGEPFYTMIGPLKREQISVNGESVESVWRRYCQKVLDEKEQDPADMEILKAYIIYFIGAPHFNISAFDNVDLSALSYHQLYDACLDIGIDPM